MSVTSLFSDEESEIYQKKSLELEIKQMVSEVSPGSKFEYSRLVFIGPKGIEKRKLISRILGVSEVDLNNKPMDGVNILYRKRFTVGGPLQYSSSTVSRYSTSRSRIFNSRKPIRVDFSPYSSDFLLESELLIAPSSDGESIMSDAQTNINSNSVRRRDGSKLYTRTPTEVDSVTSETRKFRFRDWMVPKGPKSSAIMKKPDSFRSETRENKMSKKKKRRKRSKTFDMFRFSRNLGKSRATSSSRTSKKRSESFLNYVTRSRRAKKRVSKTRSKRKSKSRNGSKENMNKESNSKLSKAESTNESENDTLNIIPLSPSMALVDHAKNDVTQKYLNSLEMGFSVWDFDVEEVFYPQHHFFLSENTVYVICFDTRKILEKNRSTRLRCA